MAWKMKLTTRITLVFLLAVSAIILGAYIAHANSEKLNQARFWVEHTHIVLGKLERLLVTIKDTETSCRGYLVTRQERFNDRYTEMKNESINQIDELVRLTQDNSAQTTRLNKLRAIYDSRVAELEVWRSENSPIGSDRWRQFLESTFNSNYAAKVRELVSQMQAEEEKLLKNRTDIALESVRATEQITLLFTVIVVAVIGAISGFVVVSMNRSITALVEGTRRISKGEFAHRIPDLGKDELGKLASSFNAMTNQLEDFDREQTEQTWVKTNLNNFGALLQGQRQLEKAASLILSNLAPLVEARQAVFYRASKDGNGDLLRLAATYACHASDGVPEKVRFGDGLLGQCALDKTRVILTDVPPDSFVIRSTLAILKPADVVVLPIIYENTLKGVLELSSEGGFTPIQLTFLDELSSFLGVVLNSVEASMLTENLLQESQQLNEELQSQQEELESQAEELQVQQEELRQVNEELHMKADALEAQNEAVSEKNAQLEELRVTLEDKAQQLAISSKYKSEFLANMSHDLRTPLNSLLIFSELLAENDEGNLQESQIEFAQNINSAGKTLLTLIDDILDLSKIESGRVTPDIKTVEIGDILLDLERSFTKVAEGKKLSFTQKLEPGTPKLMRTDERRVMQLLNNLISNAFKFTENGGVELKVGKAKLDGQHNNEDFVVFTVIDTGIGIAKEQQALVFEAFHQADSSTTRKYGGTGLGLSICRELSTLLGGWMELSSELGKGSEFKLFLPVAYKGKSSVRSKATSSPQDSTPTQAAEPIKTAAQNIEDIEVLFQSEIPDDRDNIVAGDRVLLMIEDDRSFATMLLNMARKNDFKGVVAMRGTEGLALARKLLPDAITLDLRLPDIEGWVALDQLKNNPETRHIPVHIISADTSEPSRGIRLGAIGYLEKPVTLDTLNDAIVKINEFLQRQEGNVLLVESDDTLRDSLVELLKGSSAQVSVRAVESGEAALNILQNDQFDCTIVNINLSDMNGLTLAKKLIDTGTPSPLVVFSNHGLNASETAELEALSRTNDITDADTPERLLSELGLFLHRVETNLPEPKKQALSRAGQEEVAFVGRKILIVDDDPRNVRALCSALKKYNMNLLTAENGKEALKMLEKHPDMDAVLMDIMMPIMDGYEATKAIRAQKQFESLPVIAVTAKAMQGDRQKCLESGASDYITKPVDRSQLMSLLRVWLYRA